VALDGEVRGEPVAAADQQRGVVVAAAEVAAVADFDVAVAGFGADEGLAGEGLGRQGAKGQGRSQGQDVLHV